MNTQTTTDTATIGGQTFTGDRADEARQVIAEAKASRKGKGKVKADPLAQPTADEEAANAAGAPKPPKGKKNPGVIKARIQDAPKPAPAARKARTATPPKPKLQGTAAAGVNKGEAIIGMLRRPEGATLAEMQAATGWQAHSVRGFLAGSLKKAKKLVAVRTVEQRGEDPKAGVYRLPEAEPEAIG